jgi:hypothetical protein
MKEKMIELYNSGKSFREISEILSVPTTSIWRKINNDVKIKKKSYYGEKLRKYPIDENFFEKINNKDKAYILGILLADGHRCKNVKQIRLKLQEQDKEILEKIKLILNYNKPLNFEKRSNPNHQNTYSLIICNSKICDDLEKFGVVKNKTFNINAPIIDDELFIDLFRGYFDGDGWISIYDKKYNLPELGVIGEQKFLLFLKEKLKKIYDIESYFKEDKRSDNRIQSLVIRKLNDVKKMYYMMYNNDNLLLLSRKHNKFKQIIKHDNM